MKKIIILGGYGNTGKPIARLLLQKTDAEITIAGRNKEKAIELSNSLNKEWNTKRTKGIFADASNIDSLNAAFKDHDLAVIASSTSKYIDIVSTVCIQMRLDYIDVQVSKEKINVLKQKLNQIIDANLCFITDGGFHPGIPAVLVRRTALEVDELYTGIVGSVIQINWENLEFSDSTAQELVEEMASFNKNQIYKDGKWKKVNFWGTSDFIKMDFGKEFGFRTCVPMELEEIKEIIPSIQGIKECGFYVGGFNPIVDNFILMPSLLALKVFPKTSKLVGDLMLWGLKKFSKPPYGTILKLEGIGKKNGEEKKLEITISHSDGYELTAIPVVSCILQWIDGNIRKPGIHFQANIVEPIRFLEDMKSMGVESLDNFTKK